MKTSIQTICILLVIIGSYNELCAQFRLGAEVRPRSEYRHGFKKLIDGKSQDAAFFVEQRTRLTMDYRSDKMEFMVSLQDVRIWGAENQIYKPGLNTANYFTGVNQAWGKVHLNDRWALKMGRQELDYDNARILGNLGWAQQSRSHDAALLTWKDSTSMFHFGAAYNQDGSTPEYSKLVSTYYNLSGNYKTMQFLWYHKNFEKGQFSALFLNNGLQDVDSVSRGVTRFSQTAGMIGRYAIGTLKLTGELYYQFGKDGANRDLNAYMISIALQRQFGKSFHATLGMDYLSGSRADEADNINHSFDPLYGTHHKFYGFMDYFYVGNPSAQNGRNVGIVDPYIQFNYKFLRQSALTAYVHRFYSPVNIYQNTSDMTEGLGSALGTEIDLVFATSITPGVGLNIGYSQLFATQSMQAIKGGNRNSVQNWAWLMVTFKPALFESK